MKTKINKWGNSHGIRLSASMLEHLNVQNGSQVEVKLTKNGVELVKNSNAVDLLNQTKTLVLNDLIKQSYPVTMTTDPNAEGENDYIVIDINPSQPIIREVKKGYSGAYKTLSQAKHVARQIIQQSIEEAKNSLVDIRQAGIETIGYINL